MAIAGVGSLTSFIPSVGGADSLTSVGANPMKGAERVQPAVTDLADGGLDPMSSGPGFGQYLTDAIDQVNGLQANADTLAQKLATGDVQDVHQVMLALNQASNAFGLTTQVRNKVLDAYQEVMRMQV